ncbi:DUF4913 domain-containing protein [Streptomyces sp. NBC_01750]|uniref:DUF4913 domain-containing protein n=1 Tax=Streptomyces sp. NBC_01750 TaxID=2975928 RepID=UPI002DD897BD|nr:DUF4913 domain-containing protein [Streptomyces sp. NBC_01750]WSD38141.1 DUF4913 domain-containing protein [Streptomyces sp. NBC_01750]
MSDPQPVDVLAEDLADLAATVHGFASQLEHNTRKVDQLASAVAASGNGQGDDGESEKGKEKPKTPPFILWLDGPKYNRELMALAGWVRGLLVPTYLGEVSSSATWCASWWDHPAAVARLHAAWLAWQELTDPETCGLTGPSVWHRDHLDPMLAHLRAADGPFAGCMTNPDRPQHTVLPVPPVEPLPAGLVVAEPEPEPANA